MNMPAGHTFGKLGLQSGYWQRLDWVDTVPKLVAERFGVEKCRTGHWTSDGRPAARDGGNI